MAYSRLLALVSLLSAADAFAPITTKISALTVPPSSTSTSLSMALDPVTYLRTEWVSAALCTNQTPREADAVLQLGVEDGRAVNFIPRTVREFITSSCEKKDSPESGGLSVGAERQLKQMAERRKSAKVTYSNQPVDDLRDTKSSSVDIVISLQAATRMAENGYDWKKSIQEAGRVLKPGGRFLFCESADVAGESYLDAVIEVSDFSMQIKGAGGEEGSEMMEVSAKDGTATEDGVQDEDENDKVSPIFEEVGYDQVDMVLQPHIAGVAIKAMDADMTSADKAAAMSMEESDRMAELSLNAFERGNKSNRKRRKKKKTTGMGGGMGMP